MTHRRSIGLWTPLLAWLLFGVAAFATIHVPSVVRTQEARVLETARQMQGGGVEARLLPQLNGQDRLQKPPLAYWLADASYAAFGVSAGVGRVPFALAAWLTAGLNYRIGKHFFGRRAGLIAMAGTLGCVMGARHGLLAETDVLVTLGITVAAYAHWRSVAATPSSPDDGRPFAHRAAWFHVGALGIAFAVLSKGLPAAFPILFLIAFAGATRRWRALWDWLRCGALLTALVVAVPWFVYIALRSDAGMVMKEVGVATLGGGHAKSAIAYLVLFVEALPWTPFVIAAVWIAARRCRRDERLMAALLWVGSILVPLCLAGQKQRHYLLPVIPPLTMLAGWYVDRALRAPRGDHRRLIRTLTSALAVAFGVAAIALPIAARVARGTTAAVDWPVAAGLAGLSVAMLLLIRRRGVAAAWLALVVAVPPLLIVVQNVWGPSLDVWSPKAIAADVDRRFPGQLRRMIGEDSLPLQFHLRCDPAVPATREALAAAVAAEPRTVFVDSRSDDGDAPVLPRLRLRQTYEWDGDVVRIFDVAP